MTPTRYQILQHVVAEASTNAGLWLDKYLDSDDDSKKDLAKKVLVKNIAETIQTPDIYKMYYERWKKIIDAHGAVCKQARAQGRLAINLGAASVLETSIALNHTYGTPYIPGSALKGLASHFTINHLDKDKWGKGTAAFRTMFGDTANAGYINFFDALYIPGTGHVRKPLWPDIITVHHKEYYGTGKEPPADWDNPVPIPFLTATGSFMVALSGPEGWVNAAFNILALALKREGIGAKTSCGYGRMTLSDCKNFIKPPEHIKLTSSQKELPPGYQRGVVQSFKNNFGCIRPDEGGSDVFVTIGGLAPGVKNLEPRQQVIYKLVPGKMPGQVQAIDVNPENRIERRK